LLEDTMPNPEPTHVWLHNPETNGFWECPVDTAASFVERGWQECEAPPESNAHLFSDPDDERIIRAEAPSTPASRPRGRTTTPTNVPDDPGAIPTKEQ
jgi:hypothetical protein